MAESISPRFVALDVHKTSVMIGAVDAAYTVVVQPRRVQLNQLTVWAARHLVTTDVVVLEASSSAWEIHDLLKPLVTRVVVANPHRITQIAEASVKTDNRDTRALARLLAANLIPEVWVPPSPVRDLRSLIAHRQHLIRQRSAAKNRLQRVVVRRQLPSPSGPLWLEAPDAWWQAQGLPSAERLRAQHDRASIRTLT